MHKDGKRTSAVLHKLKSTLKNRRKVSPNNDEQWLLYELSGGRLGHRPPSDWTPRTLVLSEENQRRLRRLGG